MNINIGLITYSLAACAFAVLALLLILSWQRRLSGIPIIAAAILSCLWAGISAHGYFLGQTIGETHQISEFLRNCCWFYFLFITARKQVSHKELLSALAIIAVMFAAVYSDRITINQQHLVPSEVSVAGWMFQALIILGLVEHIFRFSTIEERWKIKYLCIGLGAIFAYDFYVYADALLFKKFNTTLWAARGLINALAVPLIAISIARNPSYAITIHVSREVVFHSTTILAAGIYLLAMSLMGYLIKYYGGNWGTFLQIAFLIGAGLLLVVLLFSGSIRGKIRVFLNKHFFSFKYDYRQKWLEFTQGLSAGDDSVPETIVQAMASLTESRGGLLYENTGNNFRLLCSVNAPEPEPGQNPNLDSLERFLHSTNWVVEIPEYNSSPHLYPELQLPTWLVYTREYWLIVPLRYQKNLAGILILNPSSVERTINWEDRDLLKLAGQQAAIHLTQYQSDKELVNARQFEAFNKLSAYIVHDLKNILAQQSLIVSNAEKHKHNPAFVDDVIDTVRNSVGRMTRLMEQMRNASRSSATTVIDLPTMLANVANRFSCRQPKPVFNYTGPGIAVLADEEQLANVFSHLIQNAIEACPADGTVTIGLEARQQDSVTVIIQDSGSGMTADFVRDRLFKPFDSTKGLTGMGIGAYESREYIRALGGEIHVLSEVDLGSTFRISLPAAMGQDKNQGIIE